MKYLIFDSSIQIVTEDGKSHFITDKSENFDAVVDLLRQQKLSLVETMIRAEDRIDISCINEKDREFYFKDYRLPTSLADLVVNKMTLGDRAVLNYWINKMVASEEVSPETLRSITGSSVIALDESGFLFAVVGDRIPEGREFVPAKLTDEEIKLIGDGGLRGLCETYLGVSSKKIISLLKKLMLREDEIDSGVFNLLYFLSSYYRQKDVNTIASLIESNLIGILKEKTRGDIKAIADLLSKSFSARRLINAIGSNGDELAGEERKDENGGVIKEDPATTKNSQDDLSFMPPSKILRRNFSSMSVYWRAVGSHINLGKIHEISDLERLLRKEYEKRVRDKDFDLKQKEDIDWLTLLDGEDLGEDRCVYVPSNGRELVIWSSILGNCLHSYPEKIARGETNVIGVMKSGEIEYGVEISGSGAIVQFEGKSRSAPTSELRERLKLLIESRIRNNHKI